VFLLEQDKLSKDDFLGGFMIDLSEVPVRKPPESPLAPQWYRLEAKAGPGRVRGTWKFLVSSFTGFLMTHLIDLIVNNRILNDSNFISP